MAMSPTQRTERARIAANTRWANTADRTESTRKAREAAAARFYEQTDASLPDELRLKMAANAQKAHMARIRLMALKVNRLTGGSDDDPDADDSSTDAGKSA